ncbi:MAG TPA: vWA domain-containing protein [Planctomycetota bacterium]
MARRTREISIFNLSFLDVLSNALGAVVALMLISQQMSAAARHAEGLLPKLKDDLDKVKRDALLSEKEEETLNELLKTLKGDLKANEELIEDLLKAKAERETFKYRGLKTAKKDVVILLDLSGSMHEEREVLKRGAELIVALLSPTRFVVHHFDVVTFRSLERPIVRHWPLGRVEATPANKAKAVEWIHALPDAEFDGETPTAAAFQDVFSNLKDGVVFLLTDGAPTDGVSDDLKGLAEDDVRRLDAVRERILAGKPAGVEIRCLGIGVDFYSRGAFRRFLERLADVKDGSIGCLGL